MAVPEAAAESLHPTSRAATADRPSDLSLSHLWRQLAAAEAHLAPDEWGASHDVPRCLNMWGRSTGLCVSRPGRRVSAAVAAAGAQGWYRVPELQALVSRTVRRVVGGAARSEAPEGAAAAATRGDRTRVAFRRGAAPSSHNLAACATHCAASGVTLAVAACLFGGSREAVRALPNASAALLARRAADLARRGGTAPAKGGSGGGSGGSRKEEEEEEEDGGPLRVRRRRGTRVLIQRPHCVNFGQPLTQAAALGGGAVHAVGTRHRCSETDVTRALSEGTPACGAASGSCECADPCCGAVGLVLAVASTLVDLQAPASTPYGGGGVEVVPLARLVELAHAQGVPVVVDGAAMDMKLPELLATGADLVIVSAQKYLRGYTTGLVVGRPQLVKAVDAHHSGIGRAMKPTREGMVAAVAALEARAEDMRRACAAATSPAGAGEASETGPDAHWWTRLHAKRARQFAARLEALQGVHAAAPPATAAAPVPVVYARICGCRCEACTAARASCSGDGPALCPCPCGARRFSGGVPSSELPAGARAGSGSGAGDAATAAPAALATSCRQAPTPEAAARRQAAALAALPVPVVVAPHAFRRGLLKMEVLPEHTPEELAYAAAAVALVAAEDGARRPPHVPTLAAMTAEDEARGASAAAGPPRAGSGSSDAPEAAGGKA